MFDNSVKKETAMLAWPGHMNPIVRKGAKTAVERFFVDQVDLATLSAESIRTQDNFDTWHRRNITALAQVLNTGDRDGKWIKDRDREPYSADAVASKLVDVFLHQLIKYRPFAHLHDYLHLPIDTQVQPKIRKLAREAHEPRHRVAAGLLKNTRNVYTLSYEEYMKIQIFLWDAVDAELNDEFEKYGHSRILLNPYLWAD
jgi:hypothetical protein